MGNLIPGTGLLTKKADHTSDVAELAGPMGDLVKRGFTAVGQVVDGDGLGALKSVLPVAGRNVVQAADMLKTDSYRDQKGRKVIDTTPLEAVAKGIGFQPNNVARVQQAAGEVMQMVGMAKMRQSELSTEMAQAMFEHDQDKIAEVRAMLARWNSTNPESAIRINMAGVLTKLKAMREDKATRIEHTAPKSMRADVRKQMQGAE